MKLVVGGVASGKRSYIEGLGFAPGDFETGSIGASPVHYGLEELLRQGPLDDHAIDALCTKEAVACLEVGSGVVPVDAEERVWRERVGRTCSVLAARADQVVRMVCGIPVELKG